MPNRIQRNKLHLSKWTAAIPEKRERHFLVTRLIEHEEQPMEVILEAVYSKREYRLVWTDLKNDEVWLQGWR